MLASATAAGHIPLSTFDRYLVKAPGTQRLRLVVSFSTNRVGSCRASTRGVAANCLIRSGRRMSRTLEDLKEAHRNERRHEYRFRNLLRQRHAPGKPPKGVLLPRKHRDHGGDRHPSGGCAVHHAYCNQIDSRNEPYERGDFRDDGDLLPHRAKVKRHCSFGKEQW